MQHLNLPSIKQKNSVIRLIVSITDRHKDFHHFWENFVKLLYIESEEETLLQLQLVYTFKSAGQTNMIFSYEVKNIFEPRKAVNIEITSDLL